MPKRRQVRVPNPAEWQERHKNKTVTLSDKQYTMALICENMPSRVISREDLDPLTGTTLRSFIDRGYIEPHTATTVKWTKAGTEALVNHVSADVSRKPSGRFSAFLALATYDQRARKAEAA